MVGFDPIIRVQSRVVQRRRGLLSDRFRQRRGLISDHLTGLAVVTDRVREQPARGDGVAAFRHVDVDELA
jgi:hypothetical protein